ncbi:hypothetical protein [Megamonas funiformis]|uniref:hypothetical protein n=1 Tax=Megamonas funiformis TaxID=437897 RepID=UPI0022E49889|nr:hypothetical protein [Megamonas funiformis]
MNNKILIVTSIKPDPLNGGGHPSGLIWEIIKTFKENNINVDIFIEKESINKIYRVLHRYGIYLRKIDRDFSDYDKIIVYPENLVFGIPKLYRKKIIVLGPDSPSLRDARIYKEMKKNSAGVLETWVKGIYYNIAKYHEYRILKQVRSFLVVGKTDRFWMKNNVYVKNKIYLKEKIKFLRHPILSKVIKVNLKKENIAKKRFIFSGDLNYKFNNRFINSIINELENFNSVSSKNFLNIVVVGKKNKWIADLFKNIRICDVNYIEWIEDYNDICVIGQDVHCLPLLIGAGTKNRTLTALANGLEVISTPIGLENINLEKLSSIYITKDPKIFVKYMYKLNNKTFGELDIENLIRERLCFRKEINIRYNKDFIEFVLNEV